ncbi:DUF7260 family protein [Halorarum salinum]|uniref:DUF7260 domain-containing protein n=1 Tax=Halorarum salinum TaxID=2743089 RepID=A0A7D5QFG1_9EURY|nr:hypothetical protein [Halobaculum salinum]QLG61362.1 hypothetical protein HUG12_06280 [Halobaculum salinum]
MSDPTGGVGRLPASSVEESVESACYVAGCAHPDLVAAGAVLAVTALFLLLSGLVLTRLSDARDALGTERTRTRAERDAFRQFRQRVAGLDPSDPQPPDPTPGGGGVMAVAGGGVANDASLADARRAYRETVMATSHYEEEYDESLAENVGAEFSETVASALTDGGTLTPQLHAALATGAERARRDRDELLAALDREEATIEAAEDALAPAVAAADEIDERDLRRSSYRDFVADLERLEYHEREVESLLADRQSTVHERESERPFWYDYLYGSLPSPYPVLAAGTRTLSALADAKDELASAASDR